MTGVNIPIIDFETCGLQNEECLQEDFAVVGKQLVDAFSNVGFAYLKNYGITDSYIQDVHKVTERFFTKTSEEKKRYAMKDISNFGWIGMNEESATGNPNMPDYKEAFNINSASFARRKEEWPDDIAPGFSDAILGFMEHGRKLTLRVLRALAVGMELEDEYFFCKCHSKMHTDENNTTAKTIYYPPVKSELIPGQLWCGEHADSTFLSFLFQDQVGGLQVRTRDVEYVDATPIKGTIVVNVGDMLEILSNRNLKSTQHRVVFKEAELRNTALRRSLVYFVIPNNDVVINKPLVYKDETRNKYDESYEPLTALQWGIKMLSTYWNAGNSGE